MLLSAVSGNISIRRGDDLTGYLSEQVALRGHNCPSHDARCVYIITGNRPGGRFLRFYKTQKLLLNLHVKV